VRNLLLSTFDFNNLWDDLEIVHRLESLRLLSDKFSNVSFGQLSINRINSLEKASERYCKNLSDSSCGQPSASLSMDASVKSELPSSQTSRICIQVQHSVITDMVVLISWNHPNCNEVKLLHIFTIRMNEGICTDRDSLKELTSN
jgi:hypothetical protein